MWTPDPSIITKVTQCGPFDTRRTKSFQVWKHGYDLFMTQKMTQKTATVTSTPEVHLPDAPSGGSSTTLGVYK